MSARLSRCFGRRIRLPVLLLLAVMTGSASLAQAEPRLALVIGQSRYRDGALPTTLNDAGLVAKALAQVGFAVTAYADLDRDGINRAVQDFAAKAGQAGSDGIVFVYLAGYGVQYTGENYVVPIEARLSRDIDVPKEAVSLNDLDHALAAIPLKVRIMVEDLARTNPFAPLASGLTLVDSGSGGLTAFNAAPGWVAAPDPGPYGIYAQALAEMLAAPGLSPKAMFTRVRVRVTALSGGATVPWNTETLASTEPIVSSGTSSVSTFGSTPATSAADAFWLAIAHDTLAAYADFLKTHAVDPQAARIATQLAIRREAMTWSESFAAKTPDALWTYMRRYPRGRHFADARRALAAMPAQLEPPPRFAPMAYPDLPPPKADELALVDPRAPAPEAVTARLPPLPPGLLSERPVFDSERLLRETRLKDGPLPLPRESPFPIAAHEGSITQPQSAVHPDPARPVRAQKPPVVAAGVAGVATPVRVPIEPPVTREVVPPREPVPPTIAPVLVPEPMMQPITPLVGPLVTMPDLAPGPSQPQSADRPLVEPPKPAPTSTPAVPSPRRAPEKSARTAPALPLPPQRPKTRAGQPATHKIAAPPKTRKTNH